jgi:hypothetical protein
MWTVGSEFRGEGGMRFTRILLVLLSWVCIASSYGFLPRREGISNGELIIIGAILALAAVIVEQKK